MRLLVGGVVLPIAPSDWVEIPRVCTFDTAKVDAALRGVGAAFVVGIDPAGFAEIMLRRMGAPAVERQVVRALRDDNRSCCCGHGSGLSARAEGTIAAPDV